LKTETDAKVASDIPESHRQFANTLSSVQQILTKKQWTMIFGLSICKTFAVESFPETMLKYRIIIKNSGALALSSRQEKESYHADLIRRFNRT